MDKPREEEVSLGAYQLELAEMVYGSRPDAVANAVLQRVVETVSSDERFLGAMTELRTYLDYSNGVRAKLGMGEENYGELLSDMTVSRAKSFIERTLRELLTDPQICKLRRSSDTYYDASSPHWARNLAARLGRHYDDMFLDLALALLMTDRMDLAGGYYKMMDARRLWSVEKERLLRDQLRHSNVDVTDAWAFRGALIWAMGEDLHDRISLEESMQINIADRFLEILRTNAKLRRQLKRAFGRYLKAADGLLAGGFTLMGWMEMLKTKEVSMHEMMQAADAKCKAEDPANAWRIATEPDIKKFFEANPEPPELQSLCDKIGVDAYREELENLRLVARHHQVERKEGEIIERVCSEVANLDHDYHSKKTKPKADYKKGYPVNVVKDREVSCFSSVWLIAALLLKCGLKSTKLFYVHCHQSYDGMIGGHGMLAYLTDMNKVYQIDHGYAETAKQFQFTCIEDETVRDDLKNLLRRDTYRPVSVRIDPEVAKNTRHHQNMTFMKLEDGFTGGHLTHVGIGFYREGKFQEAEYALELALTYNANHPNTYCFLGMCRLEAGDRINARDYFEEALEVFDNCLVAQYQLGIMDWEEGNRDEAIRRFVIVAGNVNGIYGSNEFRRDAKDFLESLGIGWNEGSCARIGIQKTLNEWRRKQQKA